MRLRRLVLAGLICSAINGLTVQAQTAAPPLVAPERQGYAFEYPRILAEQRLFGLAHGIALLASACATEADNPPATAEAYAHWRSQQQDTLDQFEHELAAFFYGARADQASWAHIAETLHLPSELRLAPGSEALSAACTTLPQALQQPRYDLTERMQIEAALAALVHATRIEMFANACNHHLTEDERQTLAHRYLDWQARAEPQLTLARARMQRYWADTGTPEEEAEWMSNLRHRYSNPPASTCVGLADWLLSPAAELAQSFVVPPLPVAAEALPPTPPAETRTDATKPGSANDVDAATPAPRVLTPMPDAQQAPSPIDDAVTTEVEPDPTAGPNLFDLLKRFFDEQANSSDSDGSSGNRRARSQRAYP